MAMNPYEALLAKIKMVRRRWRTQALVRGLSLFLWCATALLVLGVWAASLFNFTPLTLWIIRAISVALIVFAAWRLIFKVIAVAANEVRVAQLIEEYYTHLEDRLVAVVEHGRKDVSQSSLIDLLIRDALGRVNELDLSVFARRKRLAYFGMLGVGACLALLALMAWGPSFFPYGFSQLYAPWTESSFSSAQAIKVEPGDIEIAKGADQLIRARLVGFDAAEAQLYLQPAGGENWNTLAMERDPRDSSFRYLLVDIREPLRYYASARGIRSRVHSISVLDLARVEKVDVTYRFPAYTRMAPQKVENEGDISAVKGTKIDLEIVFDRPVKSARVVFDNQTALDLIATGSQSFSGSFDLSRSGSYVVQVSDARAKNYSASREYEIEALDDSEPKVVITRPMRDVRATSVEEVFCEIKAEDDIEVRRLELHYSINGGNERSVLIHDGVSAPPLVTGSYTFFLEDFALQPGDIVAYYARAWDNNNVTGPGTASSDIYFIQIRPFEQRYIQNQQSGQMDGGEEMQESLSLQEKEIISATFRLIQEKNRKPAQELADDLKSLALVQGRLQTQTQGLVERLQRREAAQVDESFARLAEYLIQAVEEMRKAAANLGAQKPDDALPQEQKSLQQLMRAESLFREIQVSFGAQNAGGAQSQAQSEDLADLFELELNKLKNQYETVQRGEQQERDQKVDEALQRLKEMARRQQQVNERNRMFAQQGGSSSTSRQSRDQQQVLEQAEQLRRQLQRLSLERSSPALDEAARQLEEAVDEMRKALKGLQLGDDKQADAQGMRAWQQLNEAVRKLALSREGDLRRSLERTVAEAHELVREQAKIQQGVAELAKAGPESITAKERERRREEIASRKSVLAERLKNLQSLIDDLSRQARKDRKETAGKLSEAAGVIRERRLPERIMSGNALLQNEYYEILKQREDYIREGLESLAGKLESARASREQGKEERLAEAAQKARQLAEGLESMQQRMERTQGRAQGQGEKRDQIAPSRERAENARQPQSLPGAEYPQGGAPSTKMEVGELSRDATGAPSGMRSYQSGTDRQWSSELRQRVADAEDLKRLLERNSTEMQSLEKVVQSLRRAGEYLDLNNQKQIESLREAIEHMRRIELELARALERLSQNEKYMFSEENDAPADFRELVDEYFKALARGK